MSASEFVPTIGIECHVQLKTKTKLFAAIGNDASQAEPNSLISHICVGMPGALPVLNEGAIELCCLAAFALNTNPQKFSHFERKHYFYPDLPKGYQITQFVDPIIKGGFVEITVDGKTKKIEIERAHLEEDAGKNTHPAGADYSLVDLNRAGTPLLEIVSKPDIHSGAEAKAYARELWLAMKYAGVTDGDLYHGHTRFDVNVSVSSDPNKLGTRSETKNLNSFRSVEAAVDYEIKRQTQLLEKGEKIVQETRGWDEAKQKTVSQRSKEEAEDYRYMPEPDIPPVELEHEFINRMKASLPVLPSVIRVQLGKSGVDAQVIEDLLDRPEATASILKILETSEPGHAKRAVFWFLQSENSTEVGTDLNIEEIIKLSEMVEASELSSTAAKAVFAKVPGSNKGASELAKEMNLIQVSDESAIEKIVSEVLSENAQAAQDVKNGEMKAIGFLVGQVMAKSKGQANPGLTQQLIKKQLGI